MKKSEGNLRILICSKSLNTLNCHTILSGVAMSDGLKPGRKRVICQPFMMSANYNQGVSMCRCGGNEPLKA